MKKAKLLTVVMVCLVLLLPGQVWASPLGQAVISAPPIVISPMTVFDPSFKYLDSGSGHLSNMGNGKVDIWGETFATHDVDSVKVQITLQRWTGSSWVDVYSGPLVIYYYDNYAYDSTYVTVPTGYYYRVKSYHEVTYGTTVEFGTRYSGYLLVN